MNLSKILAQLRQELKHLDEAITSLERLQQRRLPPITAESGESIKLRPHTSRVRASKVRRKKR